MNRRNFITTTAAAIAAGAAGATGPHQTGRVDWGDGATPGGPDFLARLCPQAFLGRMCELGAATDNAVIRSATVSAGPGARWEEGAQITHLQLLRETASRAWLMQRFRVHQDFREINDNPYPRLISTQLGQNVHQVMSPGDAMVYWIVGTAYARMLYECADGSHFLWSLGDNETVSKEAKELASAPQYRRCGKTEMQTQTLRFLKMRMLGLDPDVRVCSGPLHITQLRGPAIEHLLREVIPCAHAKTSS